jgi:hypothetical protein
MNKVTLAVIPLISVLAFTGCGHSQDAKPAVQQQKVQENFKIGKTTKDEILTKFGQPTSVGKSKDSEFLMYDKVHRTGKAWIPFYFGSDRVRISHYKFTFKNGLLTDYSTGKSHF